MTPQRIKPLREAGYKKGERAAINQLAAMSDKLNPIAGPGILIDRTANGIVIRADPNFTGNSNNSGKPRWL